MGNLTQITVAAGGKLAPLVIPHGLTAGTGLMNPSIAVDDDGTILVNLRHVNYTLYHAEEAQKFPSRWGPLAYLHPENDQALRTINYLVKLDSKLNMVAHTEIEMLELHTPIWEFTGLEDARLVKWNGVWYIIGVRRDTTPNGQGRMEYSQLEIDPATFTAKEVHRVRIPAPGTDDSYCEKNWVPVTDRPFHFVKWTCPAEIVWADPEKPNVRQISLEDNFTPPADQRGSSQVIPWGNLHLSITHEVNLYKNYLSQKDAIYRHRLCVWDKEMRLIGISQPFSFLDAQIEFCAGIAEHKGNLLISFGFQDNAAFILQVPGPLVETMISEAIND